MTDRLGRLFNRGRHGSTGDSGPAAGSPTGTHHLSSDDDDRTALRAQLWLRSGWLEEEFYGALRGRRFADAEEAARDFVEHGMRERLSPHPALHFVDQPQETRKAWRAGRVRQVLRDLHAAGRAAPEGVAAYPDLARTRLMTLAEQLGRQVGRQLGETTPRVDWAAVAAQGRRPDVVTVVVVTDGAPRPMVRTVETVIEAADGQHIEVFVVDHGSATHDALGLHAALAGSSEVDVLRVPRSATSASAVDAAVARSTGEVVVLLRSPLELRRGALSALRSALDDPSVAGAQPVLLTGEDTIASAGLVVAREGEAAETLLRGHQPDDAYRLEGQSLVAIAADAMALRVADFAAVGGMPAGAAPREAALDLCAALLQRRPGGFRVVPAARANVGARAVEALETVTATPRPELPPDPGLYDRIGFVVDPPAATDGGAPRRVAVSRRRTTPEQRRWRLKLPSTPKRGGDLWGDTFFGDALARALRGWGEDVVTCRRGAHDAGPTALDDVALAVRGLFPIAPTPGLVNVMWVISHPDDVDPRELEGYDLVFAASTPWSAALSERAGRAVLPLLQASEFDPSPGVEERAHVPEEPSVVFVGTATAGRERPLIRTALEAGVPLTVYGPGWEGLPDGVWAGARFDNHRLPELYRRHGIVLADHWPDMARNGFIANRVFDVVASGARAICDDVVGIHDVFDPREVVVVHDAEDLRRAVAAMRRAPRTDDHRRPSLTFTERGRTLIDAVSGL